MAQRTWHDDEEDWSETGGDYDSGGDYMDDDGDGDAYLHLEKVSSPCPNCDAYIYDDLDHCPRCGHWLTDADREISETGLFATRRVRLIAAALLAVFLLSLIAEIFMMG